MSVGAAMALEREHLLPLVKEGFDLAAVRFPEVNSSGCAKVLTNFYSVPVGGGDRSPSQDPCRLCGDLAPGQVPGAA